MFFLIVRFSAGIAIVELSKSGALAFTGDCPQKPTVADSPVEVISQDSYSLFLTRTPRDEPLCVESGGFS